MTDKLSPSSTALVYIEFQNEFATEGGKLYPAVEPCLKTYNTLANALETLEIARSKGYTIIHAPITFSDDYREISKAPYGILANVKAGECFLASAWGGKFNESFEPKNNEIIVSGKTGLCAFASTNLDFILRQYGIKTIALAGFLTNCCIESTMRSAYELGYSVITIHDACAATSVESHDAAVKYTFPMFSHPLTHTEFLERLM